MRHVAMKWGTQLGLVAAISVLLIGGLRVEGDLKSDLKPKGGSIDQDGSVSNPDSVSADTSDDQTGILSKTFRPPGSHAFRLFTTEEKKPGAIYPTHTAIDLILSTGWTLQQGFSEAGDAITVPVKTMNWQTADNWPMKADGNLDGGGQGGKGTSGGDTPHWAATVTRAVRVTAVYSNQHGVGNPCNFLPGNAGIPQRDYLLCGQREVGIVGLDLRVETMPATAEMRNKLLFGHETETGVFTLDQGAWLTDEYRQLIISDTAASVNVRKYPVVIIDNNGSGTKDAGDTVLVFKEYEFRTCWQDDYDDAVDYLETQVLGGSFLGMMTSAPTLQAFIDSTMPPYLITQGFVVNGGPVAIQPNKATHNVGVDWQWVNGTGDPYTGNSTGNLVRWHFKTNTPTAYQAAGHPDMVLLISDLLRSKLASIRAHFAQHGGTEHTFGPWNLPASITFKKHGNGFNQINDLYYALHHAELNVAVTVTVKNTADLDVKSLDLDGRIDDLYDFDFNSGRPAHDGAIVQTGYDTVGTSGKIYFWRILLDHDLAIPRGPFDGFKLTSLEEED